MLQGYRGCKAAGATGAAGAAVPQRAAAGAGYNAAGMRLEACGSKVQVSNSQNICRILNSGRLYNNAVVVSGHQNQPP